MISENVVNIGIAKNILKIVDAGLTCGLGKPKPGFMCVEAAVCYAMGEEHGDDPSCVAGCIRDFKINLNDLKWSSKKARARGMRKLAIAQLGSELITENNFIDEIRNAFYTFIEGCMKEATKYFDKHPNIIKSIKRWSKDLSLDNIASIEDSINLVTDECELDKKQRNILAVLRNSVYDSEYPDVSSLVDSIASWYLATSVKKVANDVIYTKVADIGLAALKACKTTGCKWLNLCK